jgi:KipI family sensor histidine kinase inhibitor
MPLSIIEGARFQPASDRSLLVYLGETISVEINQRVRKLLALLVAEPIAGVCNLHPAYCSILIQFELQRLSHARLESILRGYLLRLEAVALPEPRQVQIPACYGGAFGPDLEEVASLHKMSAEEVIALHSAAIYLVYFLGFAPGYAYLGGLPPALATPRLATPRHKVPAGSVAIGGSQTGVYPFATPGGWRLIGRTPLQLFRPEKESMCLVSLGDHVRFVPITPEQFAASEQA